VCRTGRWGLWDLQSLPELRARLTSAKHAKKTSEGRGVNGGGIHTIRFIISMALFRPDA
jgi:hypothetical protein